MNGIEHPSDAGPPAGAGRDLADLTRALTSAGMVFYVGWLLFFFRQVERVFRVSPQRFAGLWDQRLEVLSFVVLPPNILIIVPAAACASAATWIAGQAQELDLAILLRLTTWSINLMGAIAAASAVVTLMTDNGSPTRAGDAAIRIAGLMFAIATSQFCRVAARRAPGG
ncbi:hypothetical protein [Ilumatobacter coccineus]|uniref:Uncharacterized protein n=1 Tax=Ilumatobacter coccineus (strain NBRC 103263 / KCTC 29153 / YM16-304) TaxID=1313172 RepID=A0A6C7E9C8_ILUCY|nr:hypothetical protein [Ilumatobacter coccineus]BAN03000.1 hypothetical protein YM304_26860 [Ilumatobacter coccineus YM16-304]